MFPEKNIARQSLLFSVSRENHTKTSSNWPGDQPERTGRATNPRELAGDVFFFVPVTDRHPNGWRLTILMKTIYGNSVSASCFAPGCGERANR